MFSYKLPDGGLNTTTFFNAQGQIKFDPPVYELRYSTVIRILEDPRWNEHFKKIVDFGCAEMGLLPLLRRIKSIEHILEVDIDEELLTSNQQRADPLLADYLQIRESPLRVEILRGSITASVEILRNVDAIIAIEIIEHLYADTLEAVPANIFGFIQPKLAIFTTPNSEFNVLFGPLLPNGFRHADHKFEWTRVEFKDWAVNVCQRYPNYSVSFMGVGKPPPDKKHLGYVSQIAIFARNDIIDKVLAEPIAENLAANPDPDVQYKEIHVIDFPFYRDERSMQTKILDEVTYHIYQYRGYANHNDKELCIRQIPIHSLINYVHSVGGTEEELRDILLKNNYNIEGDFITLLEDEKDFQDEYNLDLDEVASVETNEELSTAQNYVQNELDENWD